MRPEPISAVVRSIDEPGTGIREFTLVPAGAAQFPVFSAGSHTLVRLPIDGRTHYNAYSLLGDPEDRDRWRIAVRLQPQSRGGSRWLHEHCTPGTPLDLSWPVNLFSLVQTGHHHVLVAGGIGVTPILAHARALAAVAASFEVHYSFRGIGCAAFLPELREMAGDRLDAHDSDRDGPLDFDGMLAGQPLGTHVYTCGPAGMVAAVQAAATRLGWPADSVHSEQFVTPAGGEPFDVVAARSGRNFTVAADMSLLEAIEQQGIDAPSLCRGGACGRCELDVIEADGELVHQDVFLSAEQRASGRKIMPCVSRLRGNRLIVDC